MGSFIEINDTLQLTKQQGFPQELDLERHLEAPLSTEDFAGRVFEFKDKKDIRVYKAPPVRNFLAENRDGKWIYWGHIHMLETTQHFDTGTTSGKYKVVHLFSPDEMRQAHALLDRNEATDYFKSI